MSFPVGVSAKRAVAFLESRVEWIIATRQKVEARGVPCQYTEQQREALRQQAKAWLPPRADELAAQTGLGFRSITIRATRSKWGSCNAKGDISLSLYLMTLPVHLRDYVIIHELCHTVHHDHSKRFHDLVNSLVGGREKELQKELRQYRI